MAITATLDALADGAEAKIAAIIARAMTAAVDRYEATGNAAVPDGFRREVETVMFALWRETGVKAGSDVMEKFKGCYPAEAKADESLWERILAEFIAEFGAEKVTRIVEATADQIRRVIASGTRDGLGIQAIARQLRDAIPGLAGIRARVIARTETHTAGMHASQSVAKSSRFPLEKRWVAVEDHRTRDFGEGDGIVDEYSHRIMDGVTVPLEDPFLVPRSDGTKEALMFPGDPRGSAGNVINCRCVQAYQRKG